MIIQARINHLKPSPLTGHYNSTGSSPTPNQSWNSFRGPLSLCRYPVVRITMSSKQKSGHTIWREWVYLWSNNTYNMVKTLRKKESRIKFHPTKQDIPKIFQGVWKKYHSTINILIVFFNVYNQPTYKTWKTLWFTMIATQNVNVLNQNL